MATPYQAQQLNLTMTPTKAKRVLGNVTNVSNHTKRSTALQQRKATPMKSSRGSKQEKIKDTSLSSPSSSSSSSSSGGGKVFRYVQWRNLEGSLKLTDRTIFFRPHPCTSPPGKDTIKKLPWDQVESHQVKTISLRSDKKYLLKLRIKKQGAPAIILRFSNGRDLAEIDQEMNRKLSMQNATLPNDSSALAEAAPATTYYPIVRLGGSIPGSLTLDQDQFVFEPITHYPLPTMKIRWPRVLQHVINVRNNQASLKVTCTKSMQPIVFQLSSCQELKRLHHDMTTRLEHLQRYGESTPTNTEQQQQQQSLIRPLLASPVDNVTTPRERSATANITPKKKVTFHSPLVVETIQPAEPNAVPVTSHQVVLTGTTMSESKKITTSSSFLRKIIMAMFGLALIVGSLVPFMAAQQRNSTSVKGDQPPAVSTPLVVGREEVSLDYSSGVSEDSARQTVAPRTAETAGTPSTALMVVDQIVMSNSIMKAFVSVASPAQQSEPSPTVDTYNDDSTSTNNYNMKRKRGLESPSNFIFDTICDGMANWAKVPSKFLNKK